MITMKNVAKHAGVSVSTVSNIVNGSTSVNSEIVKKVESAMKELGYKPNASARSLRNRKSNLFGVIMPDINDNIHGDIIKGIEDVCKNHDYRLEIYTTGDIADLEIAALNKLYAQNPEAIFLSTCITDSTSHYRWEGSKETKLIFMRRKPKDFVKSVFVNHDEYAAFYNTVANYLKSNKVKNLSALTLNNEFSNEIMCTEAIKDVAADFNIPIKEIIDIDMGKETAFKAVANWIEDLPDLIITTNPKVQDGAKACVDYFNPEKKPVFLTVESFSWVRNVYPSVHNICLDYYHLGAVAANKAIDLLKDPDSISNETIIIPYNTKRSESAIVPIPKAENKILKMLLPKGAAANALKILSNKFYNRYGIALDIDIKDIIDENDFEKYDIIPIKPRQIEKLLEDGKIQRLTDTTLTTKIDTAFNSDIVNIYSKCKQKYCAIPSVCDAFLLFYRHDFFANMHYKRLYYEKYKTELAVPRNFSEYVRVTNFFTKANNEHAPIKYGAALSSKYLAELFIAILWEINGTAKIDKLSTTKSAIINTLQELKLMYANASEDTFSESEKNIVEQLTENIAAMGFLYQSEYMNLLDPTTKHRIDQLVGMSKMAGAFNIISGYSFAINANSKAKKEAEIFFDWFISDDTVIPNNILGGSQAAIAATHSAELFLINSPLIVSCQNIARDQFLSFGDDEVPFYKKHKVLNDMLLTMFKQDTDMAALSEEILNYICE